MGTLHLTLLGGFHAEVDGRGLDGLPTRKARALLAMLSTAPDYRQPRERLATILWERSAEEQARASLRQTLASVRKILAAAGAEDVLAADSDAAWLAADRCEVDTRQFEALLADGQGDSLDSACALYAGDFLLGLSLRESAFEDWVAEQRRHFQDQAQRALERLLEQSLDERDSERGAELAVRLLAIDPLQEHVHRALMTIHANGGRRNLALRQFDACRELLARELDVEPEARTLALAESIRNASAVEEAPEPAGIRDASQPGTDADTPACTAFPGEIRPVTVLFARFSESGDDEGPPDPEQHHRIAQTFQDVADAAVARYGGHVDNRLGDSVVALFGVPIAHGNDAERALRAAMDIRSATRPIADGKVASVAAHVGIASGQAVVGADATGRGEYTIAGDGVDVAHQLEHASGPGDVLATRSVVADAARFFDSEPVKGFAARSRGRPLDVERVQSLREIPRWVRSTRFVGRRVELMQIESVLDAVRDSDRAHIVYVRGEPGIGKTRLLEEAAALAETKDFGCYRALILDFGTSKSEEVQSALARGLLGIDPGADEAERVRVTGRTIDAEIIGTDRRVFLNDLLDLPQPLELKSRIDAMDDGVRTQGRTDVLTDLIRYRSIESPVLVMIEDLHWADSPVIERLAVLASALSKARVAFLMTSRVEGDPLDQPWRTATREVPLVTIDLRPLPDTDAALIANALSKQSEGFLKRCIERAQGNPLFLEQLLRVASEDEAVETIPSSVQELVLSRSDRLGTQDRDALRAASVLGQRFDIDALRALLPVGDYVCTELVNHDLVRPERDGYLFAHALIREGIYASLLSDTRRELHLGAAEWFVSRDLGLHAAHLEAAGDPRAPDAYRKAAHQEFHAYRVDRALQLLNRGLEIVSDALSCPLLNLKGEIHYHVGPTTEALTTYRAALATEPDDADRCHALVGMAMCLRMVDDYDGAATALDEAEPIAEAEALWADLARACITRANLAFSLGNTDECLPYAERALDYARRASSVELETHALGIIGDAQYATGHIQSAHEYFLHCIDAARRNGLGRLEVAHICQVAGGTLIYMLDLRRSLADSKRALELSGEFGSLRSQTQISLSISNSAYYLGEFAEARAHAENTLRLANQLGGRRTIARYRHYLGRILNAEDRRREAREVLEEGLRIARETGIGYVGGSIFGALARATEDARRRREIVEQGEALLAEGAVSHNYIEFYEDVIEVSLENEEWDEALRCAGLLEDYVGDEPLPFTDLVIARARALAAVGKGEREAALAETLHKLVTTATESGLVLVVPAMEQALAQFGK